MTLVEKTAARVPGQPEFFSLQVCEARRFYLDMSPKNPQKLTVVCGGCERCNPDYAIHRANFPYFAIEFVARGTGSLILGGAQFDLVPGTVFTYGPGVSQDIAGNAATPLVKYFVDFSGSDALILLRQRDLAPGSVTRIADPGDIGNAFDDLIKHGLSNTRYSSQLCDVLLQYLVLRIADSSIPSDGPQSPAFATYERCRQHIERHFVELKTLAQIARQCHLDPAYLCRLFRRYDHQSPYQFLMRLKMNQAAERLRSPGVLVKQIASELAFDDPCHFSRTFKSVFGLSPEHFRQLL